MSIIEQSIHIERTGIAAMTTSISTSGAMRMSTITMDFKHNVVAIIGQDGEETEVSFTDLLHLASAHPLGKQTMQHAITGVPPQESQEAMQAEADLS